jgi:hypothetical protein
MILELLEEQPPVTASTLNDTNAQTPDLIYQALENTAIDMHTPGFDYDSGFGLVDAVAAYNLLTGGGEAGVK